MTDESALRSRFMAYMKGFYDGAGLRELSGSYSNVHGGKSPERVEYERGYAEGCAARDLARRAASERIGYAPKVVKIQTP